MRGPGSKSITGAYIHCPYGHWGLLENRLILAGFLVVYNFYMFYV